jgi:hypothetical protein
MAAAAAAALRPGELSKSDLKSAISLAESRLGYEYNFLIKDLPQNRYIISVKSQMVGFAQYSIGMSSGYNSNKMIYVIDNHGEVYSAYISAAAGLMMGQQVLYAYRERGPEVADPLADPLTPAEMEFIKAMPLYDPEFSRKFKGLAAKLCDDAPENKKKGAAATVPAAAAGAGGAAAAAAVLPPALSLNVPATPATPIGEGADEDPTVGGYRRRKRTVRRGRKSRRR